VTRNLLADHSLMWAIGAQCQLQPRGATPQHTLEIAGEVAKKLLKLLQSLEDVKTSVAIGGKSSRFDGEPSIITTAV